MKDCDHEEKLPAVLCEMPEMFIPDEMINGSSTLKEVVQEDTEHMNNVLKGLYAGWERADTVAKICKLAVAQSMVIVTRRKLLLKPATFTEYKERKIPAKKTFELEPL